MSDLTVGLSIIGIIGIVLFLYAELVLLKVPPTEVIFRKSKK